MFIFRASTRTLVAALIITLSACSGGGVSQNFEARDAELIDLDADIPIIEIPASASTSGEPSDQPTVQGGGINSDNEIIVHWDLPTERENGDSMQLWEIDHYEIYYYKDRPNTGVYKVSINDAAQNQLILHGLPQGQYVFAILTVDIDGSSSKLSTHATSYVP